MKAAGCLSAFPIEFPAKSWLTNHASDENAQQERGQQLLAYYATLFTNAQVGTGSTKLHHWANNPRLLTDALLYGLS